MWAILIAFRGGIFVIFVTLYRALEVTSVIYDTVIIDFLHYFAYR